MSELVQSMFDYIMFSQLTKKELEELILNLEEKLKEGK
jgi:hypothetical protein